MYISKTKCFAQANPEKSFHEMKTHIHRSVLVFVGDVANILDEILNIANEVENVVNVASCASNEDCSTSVTSWAEEAWEDIAEFVEWVWAEILILLYLLY